MVRTHTHVLRRHLKHLADGRAQVDDADALHRHRAGDPDAFPDLVHRHGPMVFGVCRRVLGPTPDADDAFQAVFLALVRNPASVRNAKALPAWLHRVALRTARKALARRKPVHPSDEARPSRNPGPADEASWAEVRRALDEELNRLPETHRAALVLCYLDGATRDEAARRLGLTLGTLDRRLAAGRARLRDRLTRRGLGVAVLGTVAFADGLRAVVPGELARAATALAPAGASASTAVRALVVGRTILHVPTAATVLVLGTLTATLIGAAGRPAGDEPAPPQPPPAVKAVEDAPGDPLPDGAVVRMGSPRFRHAGLSDFTVLPDGKAVVTIGTDRVVRTWDLGTGRRTKAVPLKKLTGRRFAISADGKLAAACSVDTATIFDADTGEETTTVAGLKSGPSQIGFSPDGKLLYVGGDDCRMTVIDWRAGTLRTVPVDARQSGQDSTFHGYFSPDGRHFVAGVWFAQPLCVFDTATWGQVHRFKCDAATSTFTPDGKRLIVCSLKNDKGEREAVLKVFDVGTGNELARYPMGHENVYYSLTISPDGKLLGCGASDRSCLFDLTTGKVLHRLTGRPWGLGFSPDSKTFVASADSNHLRVWDVATGKERHEQAGGFGWETVTAVSPDGRWLAAAGWMDQSVRVWDTTTGKPADRFAFAGEARYARDLAFSADGRTLAAGLHYGSVQAWDVATGKERVAFRIGREAEGGQREYCHSVRLSADGRRLVTLREARRRSEGTLLTVWDVETGRALKERSIPGPLGPRAWSADRATLALAREAGVVLIDLESAEERAPLDGSASNARAVVMSPDGRLVAVPRAGSTDVSVYEVATARLVATVAGVKGDFALGADNRTLFATDEVHLAAWDLSTGKEVARRAVGEVAVTRLVPLAGRRVFTAMADGTGLVWDFAPHAAAGGKPDDKQLAEWWADLRADDPAKAYAAVWRMADAAPEVVVPFLSGHLRPEAAPDAARLNRLIADLDGDRFAVRERAVRELKALGHAAAPAVRKALEGPASAEARQRLEEIASHRPDLASQPEQLRRLRAMQVLERIGSADARKVLSDLAAGMPLAAETKEAQAALARQ